MDTPQIVSDILTADGETVDGIRLRELSLGAILLLRKIESPLFVRRDYDQVDWCKTLLLMGLDPAEGRALAADPDALAARTQAFADRITPATFDRLLTAADRILDRAFPMSKASAPASSAPGGDGAAGEAPGAPATGTSPCSGAGLPSTSASPTTPS